MPVYVKSETVSVDFTILARAGTPAPASQIHIRMVYFGVGADGEDLVLWYDQGGSLTSFTYTQATDTVDGSITFSFAPSYEGALEIAVCNGTSSSYGIIGKKTVSVFDKETTLTDTYDLPTT